MAVDVMFAVAVANQSDLTRHQLARYIEPEVNMESGQVCLGVDAGWNSTGISSAGLEEAYPRHRPECLEGSHLSEYAEIQLKVINYA